MGEPSFITGEVRRAVDNRFRVTLPTEFAESISDDEGNCVVAKERYGCLSLWRPTDWKQHIDNGVSVLRQKMETGRLQQRWDEVQRLGRLLSTRHQDIQLGNRSRFLVPESFRDFLGVTAGDNVVVVGAVICVEVWNPEAWLSVLKDEMPDFGTLFKTLAD